MLFIKVTRTTQVFSRLPASVHRSFHATDQLLASHNSLLQRPRVPALVEQFRTEELALKDPREHNLTVLKRRHRTRRRPVKRDAFATQTQQFNAALAQETAKRDIEVKKRDEARKQDYAELKQVYAELKKRDEARKQVYAKLKKKDERREQYEAATAHVAAAATLEAELFMLGMTHALYQAARNKSFEKMAKVLTKFLGRQVAAGTAPLTPLEILRIVSTALRQTEIGKKGKPYTFTKLRDLLAKNPHGFKNVLGIQGIEASAGGSPARLAVHEISLESGIIVLERVGELRKTHGTMMPFALRKDWQLARRIATELFGPDLAAFRQSLSQEDKELILYNSTLIGDLSSDS